MSCNIPQTGPCSINPDGSCQAPKECNDNIAPLDNLFIQGKDGGFKITWDNITEQYPDQTVFLIGRYTDGSTAISFVLEPTQHIDVEDLYATRRDTLRDSGQIDSLVYIREGEEIQYWIRPENATQCGAWQQGILITSADWSSGTPPPAPEYTVDWLTTPITETNEQIAQVQIAGAPEGEEYVLTITGVRCKDVPYTIEPPFTGTVPAGGELIVDNINLYDMAFGVVTASLRCTLGGVPQPTVDDAVFKLVDHYLHAANGDLVYDTDDCPISISGTYAPLGFEIVEDGINTVEHGGEVVIHSYLP